MREVSDFVVLALLGWVVAWLDIAVTGVKVVVLGCGRGCARRLVCLEGA